MTSRYTLAAGTLMLAASTASAATAPTFSQAVLQGAVMRVAADRPGPVRVGVNYQLLVPAARADAIDAQSTLIANMHATLYSMAARECETLKTVFSGDCRLVTINVNNSAVPYVPYNTQSSSVQFTANATFEITQPVSNAAGTPTP